MNNGKKFRIVNRKVLVDSLQLHFVGVAIIHFALIVLVFTSTLFVPVIIRLNSGDISSPEVQAAAHEFLILHNRLWLPLIGSLILVVLHNIIFTHRVAGPLYRFRPYLERVGAGDLSSPIKFRKRDHLKKEAEVASQMVESLRDKVISLDREFRQANRAWNDLKGELAGEASGDLRRKIDTMGDRIDECGKSLSVFKTGEEEISSESPVEVLVKEPV